MNRGIVDVRTRRRHGRIEALGVPHGEDGAGRLRRGDQQRPLRPRSAPSAFRRAVHARLDERQRHFGVALRRRGDDRQSIGPSPAHRRNARVP